MAKKVACVLILHGAYKEVPMGQYESKAAARRYVQEVDWHRPYTVKPLASK